MERLDIPTRGNVANGRGHPKLPEARLRLRQLAQQHQVLRPEHPQGAPGVAHGQEVPGRPNSRANLVNYIFLYTVLDY